VFKIIHTVQVSIERDRSREEYLWQYFSANVAIFRENVMPQTRFGVYKGPLNIVEAQQQVTLNALTKALEATGFVYAEVVEALWMGIHHVGLVKKYGDLHFLGSIASPDAEDFFCPQLFILGSTTLSLGLEHLHRVQQVIGDRDAVIPTHKRFIVLKR
jgi:fumarate reductase subunit D